MYPQTPPQMPPLPPYLDAIARQLRPEAAAVMAATYHGALAGAAQAIAAYLQQGPPAALVPVDLQAPPLAPQRPPPLSPRARTLLAQIQQAQTAGQEVPEAIKQELVSCLWQERPADRALLQRVVEARRSGADPLSVLQLDPQQQQMVELLRRQAGERRRPKPAPSEAPSIG